MAYAAYVCVYLLYGLPDYSGRRQEAYVAAHVHRGMSHDRLVQILRNSGSTWHNGYCLQEGQDISDFGGDCASSGATVQAMFMEFSSACSKKGRVATFDFDTQGRLQRMDWTQGEHFSC